MLGNPEGCYAGIHLLLVQLVVEINFANHKIKNKFMFDLSEPVSL